MKSTRFNVIVQKDDTWYVAKCIDNLVASQGKTVEDALDNLKEALELYYEDEQAICLFRYCSESRHLRIHWSKRCVSFVIFPRIV